MRRIVVLGAGLVSRPLVGYLLEHGFELVVADQEVDKARKGIAGHPRGRAVSCNIDDRSALRGLIGSADLAVSLLPATLHPVVAECCVELGKHMVTTSYVSPQMRALDHEARNKDLLLLNEMGVDPGFDHMSAMKVIHQEEKAGNTLVGFCSWCGGLPAPEANDNPFGYKFSWSPKGVLIAARNSARYLKNGKLVEIPNQRLFQRPTLVKIPRLGTFEGYPNRDSVSYMTTYGFGPQVKNMFRGTLRYRGHCKLYNQIIRLGLLEDQPKQDFSTLTCRGLLEKLFGAPLQKTIPARLRIAPKDSPLKALEYIGLLADQPIAIGNGSLMDLLANRMSQALSYRPGERDMLVMRHDLTFRTGRAGKKGHTLVSAILVDYGIPHGDTSMARTVSLPAAIGARLVLEGKIRERGVHIPVRPGIYGPILGELEQLGISMQESRKSAS